MAIGAALLLPAKTSQAAVSVVVTVTSAPQSVKVGDPITVGFSATKSGAPDDHNECQISNLRYSWVYTVTGSDGGVVTYNLSGPSASATHTANALCQSYTVTGTCTVSYDSSPECGGGGSATGSASADVEVTGTPCES